MKYTLKLKHQLKVICILQWYFKTWWFNDDGTDANSFLLLTWCVGSVYVQTQNQSCKKKKQYFNLTYNGETAIIHLSRELKLISRTFLCHAPDKMRSFVIIIIRA